MELPKFKYSPNAYSIGIFEQEEGVCSVCNEKRQIKYTSSFYSVENPEYICPWCIANGKAAEKFNGEFNDYCGIEGVSPNPNDSIPAIPKELLTEITDKTPSYTSWQQEVWLTHCNEPCTFIDYADTETIKPYLEELKEDIDAINQNYGVNMMEYLTKDGGVVGYLFQCVKCGKHRLHIDCD